jgi:dephospho-CoA kinase
MNNFDDNVAVIGITGGIGSGKSSTAKFFEVKGYPLIALDDLAKDIMLNSPKVKKSIISAFGSHSYNQDDSLNNSHLSSKVFGSSQENINNLNILNSIVHPEVIDTMITKIEKLIESGQKLIFVESAIIFEVGLDEGFDYIITVDSPEELCIKRVMQRSSLTEDEVKARINQQMNTKEKVQLSDFCIVNDSDLDKLQKSVEKLLDILLVMI